MHLPSHAFASHDDAVIVSEFRMDVGKAVGIAGAALDRCNLARQHQIHSVPLHIVPAEWVT